VVRKRLNIVGPFSLFAIVVAFVIVLLSPLDTSGALLDLELRASGLGSLASTVILATLFLLVLDVWLDEPAYNFFPTALAVGATSLGVLILTAPLAIFGLANFSDATLSGLEATGAVFTNASMPRAKFDSAELHTGGPADAIGGLHLDIVVAGRRMDAEPRRGAFA